MDESDGPVTPGQSVPAADGDAVPPGNHPLEIAARAGIGPLSALGGQVWHGKARPCVSCGQLAPRDGTECEHCGQDLSEQMLQRMRSHAGPWFVFEHLRPFPGVTLERIVRQIHRGTLMDTSIVRGPATDFQWRFAVETPGLCRYFGRCWQCQAEVTPADTHCTKCSAHLSFEQPPPASAVADVQAAPPAPEPAPQPPPPPAQEIQQLTAALDNAALPRHDVDLAGPPRIAGISATWIAAAVMIAVIFVLMWVTQVRRSDTTVSPLPVPGIICTAFDGTETRG